MHAALLCRHALPPVDPILVVARSAAASTDLLCLDELHVTDVADAMLLSRLFGELLACGCAVVFTSNRPPRDLYKGGLSRRYFEPFIHLVDNRWMQSGGWVGGWVIRPVMVGLCHSLCTIQLLSSAFKASATQVAQSCVCQCVHGAQ